MTIFLVIVGLSGSLLAFYPELDSLFNPSVYAVSPGKPLEPGELAARAEAATGLRVTSVATYRPGVAAWLRVEARKGQPETKFEYLRIDPVSGVEISRENWGAISEGVQNLMPFIYTLHYELALGTFGIWVLGIVALVWTLDCFVGFYLTLPAKRRQHTSQVELANHRNKTWWQRWKPAWLIRSCAGTYKLNFDLHRAGGLWLWAMLLVFAWSSVYMNLSDTVYTWATRLVAPYHTTADLPERVEPLAEPKLAWREAQSTASQLMQDSASKHGFKVETPFALSYDSTRGVYEYRVRSSLDILDAGGMTRLIFDAESGGLRLLLLPQGQYSGNTITSWLVALHEGNIFGMAYRIFVCALGLAIVMLSVTGVYIWLKKSKVKQKISRNIVHTAK